MHKTKKQLEQDPHEISIGHVDQVVKPCGGKGRCPRGGRFILRWLFKHRGFTKVATRIRCEIHARRFAKKHGVEFAPLPVFTLPPRQSITDKVVTT